MLKKIYTPILLVFLGLFLFSCENKTPIDAGVFYKDLIKTDIGIIRGVNINDKSKHIKKQEKKKALITETASFIEYEYQLENGTYIVVYHVDSKGCSEINIDTYFNTPEKTQEVITTYQIYFDKKYGKAIIGDSLYKWSNADNSISVELDYMHQEDGEIMLTIYAKD